MEEQFIKDAKEGWWFAAVAARITDERGGSKAYIRFLWQSTAIWEQLLERKKEQLCPSQETKNIARVWVAVRGGMRMFAACVWHTEGWSP